MASDLGIGVSTLKIWLNKHDHGRLLKTEKQTKEEEMLSKEIKRIFYEHKRRYGSPRVFKELKENGVSCSEKRVAKIMKNKKLVGKKRKNWRNKLFHILGFCKPIRAFSKYGVIP